MLDKSSKIYVAGHRGLVGSAIWNNLMQRGFTNLVGRTHKELDLLDPIAVREFFDKEQPDAVVLAAAHVGGIMANLQYRADFIYRNLQIQQNVIGESFRHGVKKLLFLGSTCIYPREAMQPMKEEALLTSPLEYTNEPYAIAKIAGLKMCESFNLQYGTNYIAVMPTNLYGPNDNFHLENSHVLPAMIRKIHLAKYKMRLEAMKRQADRPSKENASPVATNFLQGRSDVELGEQVGESKDQVRRSHGTLQKGDHFGLHLAQFRRPHLRRATALFGLRVPGRHLRLCLADLLRLLGLLGHGILASHRVNCNNTTT